MNLAVQEYRKATSLFHSDGSYHFGRWLEYDKGINQNLPSHVKSSHLSSELENAAAENSFKLFRDQHIGVHFLGSIISAQFTNDIRLVSTSSTDVVFNRTSTSRQNITKSGQIAIIRKQNSITVTVFVSSVERNHMIVLPRLFVIHHNLIACQTFSVTRLKIRR
jgi:hypothetical protein